MEKAIPKGWPTPLNFGAGDGNRTHISTLARPLHDFDGFRQGRFFIGETIHLPPHCHTPFDDFGYPMDTYMDTR